MGINPKEILYHRGTEYTEINSSFLTGIPPRNKLCPRAMAITFVSVA
jgi:hypothetical protein